MSEALAILKRNSELIDAELRRVLRRHPSAPPRLIDAIEYSLMAGGKRLRPTLVMESESAVTGKDPSSTALPAACAIELIHTFSLVHDDLPAMDDDDLRR